MEADTANYGQEMTTLTSTALQKHTQAQDENASPPPYDQLLSERTDSAQDGTVSTQSVGTSVNNAQVVHAPTGSGSLSPDDEADDSGADLENSANLEYGAGYALLPVLEPAESSFKFPEHEHLKLQDRIFKLKWSVPVEPGEELGLCMEAATKLVPTERFIMDEVCVQFCKNALPECVTKLITSSDVKTWSDSIQASIRHLMRVFIRLCVLLIKHANGEILDAVLPKLAHVFDDSEEFGRRNEEHEATLPEIYAKSTRKTKYYKDVW